MVMDDIDRELENYQKAMDNEKKKNSTDKLVAILGFGSGDNYLCIFLVEISSP